MKKIRLKFFGLGYCNNFQANIFIYSECNSLTYQGMTFNGELIVCLEEGKAYKIVAEIAGQKLISSFYVTSNDNYSFSFNSIIDESNSITFLLTDYYNNLPIERGKLILWQS